MKPVGQTQILQIQQSAEAWSPEQILSWAFDTYGESVAVSSAFGSQGMVLIDMAARTRKNFRLFTLDTEFLFPETYDLMEQVEDRYGITIERVYSTLSPESQQSSHGSELWAHDPDRCCNLRKVEPLRRKLSTLNAWVTSIRREQTPNRARAQKIEWDAKFGLGKVNPIVDWTEKQVWRYIHDHDLPYNKLHDFGYPSLGCTHCTRAIVAGELQRDGRWPGFAKTECGLHIIEAPVLGPDERRSRAAEAGN